MMIMLRDDPVIEVFESAGTPPNWIECIDIENGEYKFCEDTGQRFVGEVVQRAGFLRREQFRLKPEGEPDVMNALRLLDQAKTIEPNEYFADLESLRRHILDRQTKTTDQDTLQAARHVR
jgi:hypothetical protein